MKSIQKLTSIQKLKLVLAISVIALIVHFPLSQPNFAKWLIIITGIVFAAGMTVSMIKSIRSGSYGVDLLAITAIIATIWVGEYGATMLILLMLVSGSALEEYATGRANRELSALLEKAPEIAHVKNGDKIEDRTIDSVEIGTVLLVKPMEVIPIDSVLVSEAAILDESSVTGETKPNEIVAGDEVLSGAINGSASIEIRTTTAASESQFQKIVALVKEAAESPANFVRLADRYAVPFTIISYVLAFTAYFISGDPKRIAEVLVVASPCPLIIAAPIAFVSGMSRSSKNGFLVKNGTVIEKLAYAKAIFFDKTGTITDGKITVEGLAPAEGVAEEDLLNTVYTVEKASSHILAKAVTSYAEERNAKTLDLPEMTEVAGLGVTGVVDGKPFKLGRASFVGAPDDLDFETAFYVALDGKYMGAVTFSDTLRKEAPQVMKDLGSLGVEKITMLTGDNERVASKIAAEVGITNYHASMLPQEKLEKIKESELHPSIMVGDGVNDAPALTLADVGISIGTGNSTVASEAADIVLLKNDLHNIPKAMIISRDTMKIAKEAVLIGIFICLVVMVIAAIGYIPTLLGAVFQEVIDVITIAYALRALHGKTKLN